MLVGGGRAFGPKPRDFSTKLPRKVISMGMRVALSTKMRERSLGVMTTMDWPSGKTGPLSRKIDELGYRKTLFITGRSPEVYRKGLDFPFKLKWALANIPSVKFIMAENVTVYDLLYWPRVIMDLQGVEYFENTLKKDVPLLPLPLLESTSS
jgi:large subunit ribosomal protein L4